MTYGSGSGTETYFAVEARTRYIKPQVQGGMILDKEWRRVYFPKSPIGVPIIVYNSQAESLGLMNYEAALALAAWFMALPDGDDSIPGLRTHAYCIETRIVKVKITYRYSTEEVGVGPAMAAMTMMRDTKFEPRPAELKEQS